MSGTLPRQEKGVWDGRPTQKADAPGDMRDLLPTCQHQGMLPRYIKSNRLPVDLPALWSSEP
ncbi:hypothetical protein BN1723_002544 [Verticillium longisporum]|uniref:Uncharacterized protein n=1 Tax=Verticillium longisporum TaxID=100787 RepID=A0A0G4LBL5_VERLO|nr:hypothetical protein BN1723_002544 [Verticillium longisporum]